MALNDILGSAASGLAAAQAGLRTVSNNIANVGVAGYARQRVNLSTGVAGGNVSGVVVGEPTRVADRFLESTVYRRGGDYGRADVTANYLDRLQALLGQPGASTGLPARLDAITASAVAMTGSQSSTQTVAAFTANVQDAISSMQQLDSDVSGLRADVESEVGYTVDKVNDLLKRIHELNGTVAQATGLGKDATGAADQRMSAIQELSSLVAINVRDQPDGRVTIDSANGAVLLDKRLRQLSYPTAGQGVSQPTYPDIEIRFADDKNGMATGEKIDSAAVGGKLGGLLDLRDRQLPAFSEQMGQLFNGLAETLNAVSNAGTTMPAPSRMDGRATGLGGSDKLNFTGAATFAVVDAKGNMVEKTKIDFDALGPNATVDDMVAAINTGLNGAATAKFENGKLSLVANGSGNGVAIAQETPASARRGTTESPGPGVSQFFGMNDMVQSNNGSLVPSGFTETDPHGFDSTETVQIVLRDPTGRALTSYTLKPQDGGTFGDLVDDLNDSPLKQFGSFDLDEKGRLVFDPLPSVSGAALSIPTDSTNRNGASFTKLMGLTGASSGLSGAEVKPSVLADPARLPLARLDTSAAKGAKALGTGDLRGATAFVDQLGKPVDLGKDGKATLDRFSSLLLGKAGLAANQAQANLNDAAARQADAVNRRDSFSGVNIDEELAQMVVLQNSYSAAARVLTTANDMYETLIGMVR